MENTRIIHEVKVRTLPVQLTEEERQDYARQLALEVDKYDTIEQEKKSVTKLLGDQLKDQRGVLDSIALKVNKGIEDREVECTVLHDYHKKMVEVFRNDTNDIVEQRPMTKQEYLVFMQTKMDDEDYNL